MKEWLELFGAGQFTCGAKFICFLPKGSSECTRVAQAPRGTEDQSEWTMFADAITKMLNEMKNGALPQDERE